MRGEALVIYGQHPGKQGYAHSLEIIVLVHGAFRPMAPYWVTQICLTNALMADPLGVKFFYFVGMHLVLPLS